MNVSVEFYNKAEKEGFDKYSNSEDIKNYIGENISISKDELMTYMMFTQQDDRDGWRTFQELSLKISGTLGHIDEFVDFSGNSIKSKVNSEVLNEANYTEKIGVAMGLCLINKIHGLTEADWNKTAKRYREGRRQKDLDFEHSLASDGSKYIQVENKGVVNEDNNMKSSGVSSKYKNIHEKKKQLNDEDNLQNRSGNIYYGTIAVLDKKNEGKILLVDPPADVFEMEPDKFKLLNRLEFYSELLKEIDLTEQFVRRLDDRIDQIRSSSIYNELNNQSLPFEFESISQFYENRIILMSRRNREIQYLGRFYNEKEGGIMFQIIPVQLLLMLINQDFQTILNYRYQSGFGEFNGFNIFQTDLDRFKSFERIEDNRYSFKGEILQNSSGRIVGVHKSQM